MVTLIFKQRSTLLTLQQSSWLETDQGKQRWWIRKGKWKPYHVAMFPWVWKQKLTSHILQCGISGPRWKKKSCLGPHIKYMNTNENWWATENKVLSKFMVLYWAGFIAILGCMWPVGRGWDTPARAFSLKPYLSLVRKNATWPPRSGILKCACQQINMLEYILFIEFANIHFNTTPKSFVKVKSTTILIPNGSPSSTPINPIFKKKKKDNVGLDCKESYLPACHVFSIIFFSFKKPTKNWICPRL